MILLGVIHWCISIRLASCSSHPSMFVQSVYHSGKSWRHWLTIINLVFISNVLKTIIIIGIELCLAWNTCCVWSVTATCISILWLNLALIQGINTGLYHPISLPLHSLCVTWSEEVSLFLFLDFYPLASQTQFSLQMIYPAHQGNYH